MKLFTITLPIRFFSTFFADTCSTKTGNPEKGGKCGNKTHGPWHITVGRLPFDCILSLIMNILSDSISGWRILGTLLGTRFCVSSSVEQLINSNLLIFYESVDSAPDDNGALSFYLHIYMNGQKRHKKHIYQRLDQCSSELFQKLDSTCRKGSEISF